MGLIEHVTVSAGVERRGKVRGGRRGSESEREEREERKVMKKRDKTSK